MSNAVTASLEAIKYQGKSELHKGMTAAFEEILAGVENYKKTTTESLKLTEIEKLLKKHTGLPTLVVMDRDHDYNMCVEFPLFDFSNPLLIRFKDYLGSSYISDNYQQGEMKKAGLARKDLKGMIDLKNSRVSGVLCSYAATIHIPFRMFDGRMSAEELSAVVLHEQGHVFTYLENVLESVSTNITLQSAWRDYSHAQDNTQRVRIVDSAIAALSIENVKGKDFENFKTQEEFTTVIMSSKFQTARTNLQSSAYDTRNSEVSADQFAVRHGAGVPLLTALDKMWRYYGIPEASSNFKYYGSMALIAAMTAVFTVFNPAGTAALIIIYGLAFLAAPGLDAADYDNPHERIERARQDLIQVSKQYKMTADQGKDVLQQIKALETLAAALKQRSEFAMMIWRNLTAHRRNQHAQKLFQRELESMANNQLFVHSLQLKDLANH